MSEQDCHLGGEVVVYFDPTSRKTVISGLPGNVQVGLELPDGVVPSAIYVSLSGDRALQVRLAEAVKLAVEETLGLRGVRQVEQSDVEPFPIPAWARIGLPRLQDEVDRFYKFLGLSPDQIVAMQMLGGVLSLYYWYPANVSYNFNIPTETRLQLQNILKEHVVTSICDDLKKYIAHLEEVDFPFREQASSLLLQVDEIMSTVQNLLGKENPFTYVVNKGVASDNDGIFSQIVEAVVFSDENIRQRLDKLVIALHQFPLHESISNKYTRVELDEVLRLVESTGARDFIRSARKTKTLTPYNVTPRDCREFVSNYLTREFQARAPQIEIQQHALPFVHTMLNG